MLELRNRFKTLQEKEEKNTPNDEYENLVNAHPRGSIEVLFQQSQERNIEPHGKQKRLKKNVQ